MVRRLSSAPSIGESASIGEEIFIVAWASHSGSVCRCDVYFDSCVLVNCTVHVHGRLQLATNVNTLSERYSYVTLGQTMSIAAFRLAETEELRQGRPLAVIHPLPPTAVLPHGVNDSTDWTLIELWTITCKHARPWNTGY